MQGGLSCAGPNASLLLATPGLLSGPGGVQYVVLSYGCSNRCGSCACDTFLQSLPAEQHPNLWASRALSADKMSSTTTWGYIL
jgi:hypothetical protein